MMKQANHQIAVWSLALILLSISIIGCNSFRETSPFGKTTLRLGTETALESTETRGARQLAKLVKEKSNGALEIEVYENAKLGTMRIRNESMRMGTVDMGTCSVGFLATYEPLTGIFDLPYLYQDKAHEMRVFDGPIGKDIDQKLQAQGLRVLCYFDAGARHITSSSKPIYTPADLKGFRIRVPQSEASIEGFKALGCTTMPLPFGEVYTALQNNTVEAQENPLSLIFHNKFYEVQKYLSLTNHQLFIQVLLISEKSWRKLSAQQQQLLMEAAKEAQSYERKIALEDEIELINHLKEKGMIVNEVSQTEEFESKTRPLRELYKKRFGKQASDLLEKIDALRN
jgi:TRAP-type transport system periplasmic protein